MPWVEVFIVFFVSHLLGDFVVQTEWQAMNKHCGLGRDATRLRALLAHIGSYSLAFVPALVWLSGEHSAGVVGATWLAIAIPHLIQDDGRLLKVYIRKIKRTDSGPSPLYTWIDFSFHMFALFTAAVVVGV